ncbi:MAG: XdhC family protein, partial [Deltaproteobacteria bacterium]|nr:XdhC family protein [Deltaproteobacteria bacterium]
MHKIAQRMYQALESGQDVVLATIVSHSGSTPRTAGTRMMILPDSTIVGTIGGGIIEARVIEAAADVRLAGEPKKLSFDLNQSGRRDNLDIICGGRLTVILEPVPATPDNIDLYRDCYVLLRQGVPCLVISSLFAEKAGRQKVERCLYTKNHVTQGSFSAPEPLLKALTHLSVKERT